MAARPLLVVVWRRETFFFGDVATSRRRFEPRNLTFWRRNPFSSSFLDGKHYILATRPLLVVFLSRKTAFFGDEIPSRR
ncbi:hypothetical protein NSQ14_01515 [Caldifermentibacillus hisashii]|uniref:hypothetical protein n=1 Tax=Caldifermentibacillus hisashii TaxID=996558 RepID=UPI0031FD4C96